MAAQRDAEFVIVGGGAVGCAVAYSLVQAGKSDVVVLEKEPALCSVTSAQAAGLVGQVRPSWERTRLAMWSVETFSRLEQDPEVRPNWRQVGSLRIAQTPERVAEFQRLVAVAERAGLHVELLTPQAASGRWGHLRFDTSLAVIWCPSDGYIQPYDLAMCYRHQAQRAGVRFLTNTPLAAIRIENGRVSAVESSAGRIGCRYVINAAGAHAYHVARLVGLELPIVPVRHEYFITVHAPGWEPTLPAFRVPDATLYGRPEVNSLLLGGWEPAALSLLPDSFASGDEPPAIREDWEVLGSFANQFAGLFPAVEELGIRSVFKGWPTFVPDGRFIVGESCRVPGFVMAGGCNAHGVSGSAGIGRHVVESILEARPSEYVRSLSPDRFTERPWDWATARRQAQAVYESYYAVSAP